MRRLLKILTLLFLTCSCGQDKKDIENPVFIQMNDSKDSIESNNEEKEIEEPENKNDSLEIHNCNTSDLVVLDSLIENRKFLYDQDVAMYIMSLNPECTSNVEYSEMNNELMFKILNLDAERFISLLAHINKKSNTLDYVLNNLENPIHDGIDLKEIQNKLNNVEKSDSLVYSKITNAIINAIGKK